MQSTNHKLLLSTAVPLEKRDPDTGNSHVDVDPHLGDGPPGGRLPGEDDPQVPRRHPGQSDARELPGTGAPSDLPAEIRRIVAREERPPARGVPRRQPRVQYHPVEPPPAAEVQVEVVTGPLGVTGRPAGA